MKTVQCAGLEKFFSKSHIKQKHGPFGIGELKGQKAARCPHCFYWHLIKLDEQLERRQTA